MVSEEERGAAELSRIKAETRKLAAEADKLAAEADKLAAEAGKLDAERQRLRRSIVRDTWTIVLALFHGRSGGATIREQSGLAVGVTGVAAT